MTAVGRSSDQWIRTNYVDVSNANVAGSLFALPGGDVGFSLGYEHRKESTRFDPGAFFFGERRSL